MKFRINDACGEDWRRMAPVEHGRHCDRCDKRVVDASRMTKKQFLTVFGAAQNGVCAKLRIGGDGNAVFREERKPPRRRRGASLALAGAIAGCSGGAGEPAAEMAEQNDPHMDPTVHGTITPTMGTTEVVPETVPWEQAPEGESGEPPEGSGAEGTPVVPPAHPDEEELMGDVAEEPEHPVRQGEVAAQVEPGEEGGASESGPGCENNSAGEEGATQMPEEPAALLGEVAWEHE